MTGQRTHPVTRMTENHKARLRLPLLALITVIFPSVTGVSSSAVWVLYALFAVGYSLWALHLTARFAGDRRLGYLLCLTDTAVMLPLLVWGADLSLRMLVLMVCAAGFSITYVIDRARPVRHDDVPRPHCVRADSQGRGPLDAQTELERAVRCRLSQYADEGVRFGLVILRILRFDEAVTYYGSEPAARMISAVARRGSYHLGPRAQVFTLGRGRVAFLFEIEESPSSLGADSQDWIEPYDVEGMAMKLGRKTCERLIDGHRVECVVGWASAPADGLSTDDLLFAAESGTRGTEAFRRVGGSKVAVAVVSSSGPRARPAVAAVSEETRTAVG